MFQAVRSAGIPCCMPTKTRNLWMMKEGETTKEKSNDESGSILTSALPSPEQVASTHAPIIQGIYYQIFSSLIAYYLLFSLPVFVLDTAAASTSTPTDQVTTRNVYMCFVLHLRW